MKTAYPITANCNFESRDDAEGKAIHAARKTVDSGRCDCSAVIEALEDLEGVLTDHADSGSEESVRLCGDAEQAVASAYARWHSSQGEG